jgi:hypothetical protein
MLHFALVQNLLTSIGAAPHLGRPNLPPPPGHFPAAVSLTLLPFLEERLRDAKAFCERIQADTPNLSAALTPIATSLQKQADALETT